MAMGPNGDSDGLLERLEDEERALSARRARLHRRIDFLRANGNADGVPASPAQLEALDEDDLEWLHGMIQAHDDATDSAVGQRNLADWTAEQQRFAKVMPRDYKRVLEAIAEAERDGTDPDRAIMAAASA